MKFTLSLILLFSFVVQTSLMSEAYAQAQAIEQAAQVSKLASVKNLWPGTDHKFVAALTVMLPIGTIFGALMGPNIIKGLCAIEARVSIRGRFMPDRQTCDLYYGDPRLNSCQVANDGVALVFPNSDPSQKGTVIRYVGAFEQTKLRSIHYSIGTMDKKQKFTPITLPVEMFFDGSEMAADFRPAPGVSILKSDSLSEDDKDAFAHFNDVAAVMREAKNECRDGMYDKTIQEILKRHHGVGSVAAKGKR